MNKKQEELIKEITFLLELAGHHKAKDLKEEFSELFEEKLNEEGNKVSGYLYYEPK